MENGQCVNHGLSFVQGGICSDCLCREDLHLFWPFATFIYKRVERGQEMIARERWIRNRKCPHDLHTLCFGACVL